MCIHCGADDIDGQEETVTEVNDSEVEELDLNNMKSLYNASIAGAEASLITALSLRDQIADHLGKSYLGSSGKSAQKLEEAHSLIVQAKSFSGVDFFRKSAS